VIIEKQIKVQMALNLCLKTIVHMPPPGKPIIDRTIYLFASLD